MTNKIEFKFQCYIKIIHTKGINTIGNLRNHEVIIFLTILLLGYLNMTYITGVQIISCILSSNSVLSINEISFDKND